MSTRINNLNKVVNVVKQLDDLILQNDKLCQTESGKNLFKAAEQLFLSVCKEVGADHTKSTSRKSTLMASMIEDNHTSVRERINAGISSKEMYEGQFPTNAMMLSATKQIKQKSDSPLILDQSGIEFLSGSLNDVNHNLDERESALVDKTLTHRLESALNRYAISLDPMYERAYKNTTPEEFASSTFRMANSVTGDQFFGVERALTMLTFNKFDRQGSYESGNDRTYYGSDVFSNLVNDLANSSGKMGAVIKTPVDEIQTDVVQPSLAKVANVDFNNVHSATASKQNFLQFTATVHKALDVLESGQVKVVDLNGKEADKEFIDEIKRDLHSSSTVLDQMNVSKRKAYNVGFDWHPKEELGRGMELSH